MSVLLPAPFSPMSASTSPARTSSSTFLRARVAPNDLETADMRSSGVRLSADIADQRNCSSVAREVVNSAAARLSLAAEKSLRVAARVPEWGAREAGRRFRRLPELAL